MLNIDQVLSLHKMACECDDKIRVKCPNCLMAEVTLHLSTELGTTQTAHNTLATEVKQLRDAIANVNRRHDIHIEALQHYYHLTNKNCPCMIMLKGIPKGKCESPWKTLGANEVVTRLKREEELTAITMYLAEKKGGNCGS